MMCDVLSRTGQVEQLILGSSVVLGGALEFSVGGGSFA